MNISTYVANFFAALFLCNCIPHLASGLRGEHFPTPFARPSGVGKSSAVVNFLWGSFNLFIGVALLAFRPLIIGPNLNSALFILGFLLIGLWLAHHFDEVRNKK
jgi:hypothetical protein